MYKWNDILIVGDSVAAHRHEPKQWPLALTLKLTGEDYNRNKLPRGRGFPGGAWWSTRKNLLNELKVSVPKILIICHTNEDRIPSDYDYGLTSGCVHSEKLLWRPDDDTNYTSDIFKATQQYFKYLYSPSYHLWAMEQWFIELDSILSEEKIDKIIHLHGFSKKANNGQSNCLPKVFNMGITSEEILVDLALGRYNHAFDESTGIFANHFKLPENITIANSLFNAIVNYKPEQNGTVQNLNLLGVI